MEGFRKMTHCFNCGLKESECECDGTDGLHYKKCNCKKYEDYEK